MNTPHHDQLVAAGEKAAEARKIADRDLLEAQELFKAAETAKQIYKDAQKHAQETAKRAEDAMARATQSHAAAAQAIREAQAIAGQPQTV